jgi:hypothetical protein
MIEVSDAGERARLMPLLNEAVHEVYVERRDPLRAPARIPLQASPAHRA